MPKFSSSGGLCVWADREGGGGARRSNCSGRSPGGGEGGNMLLDCYLDVVGGLVSLRDLKRQDQRQSERKR